MYSYGGGMQLYKLIPHYLRQEPYHRCSAYTQTSDKRIGLGGEHESDLGKGYTRSCSSSFATSSEQITAFAQRISSAARTILARVGSLTTITTSSSPNSTTSRSVSRLMA